MVCISATDFEMGITCMIAQAEVEKEGVAVVPAERLAAIVRESVDEVLVMEVSEATCRIKGSDSNFTIYGHQPEQYPQVPGFDGEAQIEADLVKLQEALEHCLFATAKENTRYALSGILWEPSGKKLTLVGTDGRRLAKYKLGLNAEVDKKLEGEKYIVPAKAMALLDKIGASEKDKISIRFVDSKAIFSCGKVVISTNLVEGTFPKYEDIIPADYKNKLQLNTAATNEDSKGVKLAITKKSIVFTSRAPEMGDAEIAMEIDYKGEPIEIGFNPQFLVDMLRVIREDSFELQLGQSDRPGLIKSGTNYVYIVMPVSLS
jgi:DNA polymerase-3 subunit beta